MVRGSIKHYSVLGYAWLGFENKNWDIIDGFIFNEWVYCTYVSESVSSYHLNDIETISEFKYKMIKTQSDYKICPLDKYNIMIFDRIIKTFVDHFLFFLNVRKHIFHLFIYV